MGSVAHLSTTGDNDPEIHPVERFRHYLYCDRCGSFDLEPRIVPENHPAIERRRGRLAKAALLGLPLVAVPGWMALGLPASPTFLVILVAGILLRMLWGGYASDWRLLGAAIVWLPGVAAAEILAATVVPPWVLLVAGVAVIAALLVWRARLASEHAPRGLGCTACGATYAYGTSFFTDLKANPRDLTVDDVPRPLGVSPFEEGATVGPAPEPPGSPLPP